MKACNSCGKEIVGNSVNCYHCGAQLPDEENKNFSSSVTQWPSPNSFDGDNSNVKGGQNSFANNGATNNFEVSQQQNSVARNDEFFVPPAVVGSRYHMDNSDSSKTIEGYKNHEDLEPQYSGESGNPNFNENCKYGEGNPNKYAEANGSATNEYDSCFNQSEVLEKSNDTLGIIAYLGILGWLIALLISDESRRRSEFVRFHMNQALVLHLSSFLAIIPIIGWIWGVIVFICLVIGCVSAISGNMDKIPVLGDIHLFRE